MTSDYPQQFSTQQLETICKLTDDDSDIEYEELMEIVKIARAELDKMQKLCSATKNGTDDGEASSILFFNNAK